MRQLRLPFLLTKEFNNDKYNKDLGETIMTIRVNGGIITQQVLAGSLRYFKMSGPFAWTVSNGTVNLPVSITGGATPVTTYFVVGDTFPVPDSAANRALQVITKQCTVTIIGMDATNGSTGIIYFAVENTSMGWGSDTPPYSVPPANTPEDPTAAATQIQAAVRALGTLTVYSTVGSVDPTHVPVTASADMTTVTVTETTFKLV